MRQRRDFDAHVLEYTALKILALPFQADNSILQIHSTPAIASASLREFKKATSRPAFDHEGAFLHKP